MSTKKSIFSLIILIVSVFGLSYYFIQKNSEHLLNETSDHSAIAQYLAKNYPQIELALLDNEPYNQYEIPNLEQVYSINVKTGKISITSEMVPQGLVVVEDYLVISAYNKEKEFQSVLFLLNKNSGKYVKTIVLPGTPHVGGLAYDPLHKNLWVTTEAENGSAQISALSLEQIEDDDFEHSKKSIDYLTQTLLSDVKHASFMTYYNEELWIGDFTKEHEGNLVSYYLNERGFLDFTRKGNNQKLKSRRAQDETYNTEKELQGIAFYHDTILFSQSFGDKSSHLLLFQNDVNKSQFDFDSKDLIQSIDFPSYLEQIFVEGERLYTIFESDAATYRARPNSYPINHILVFDFTKLIKQQ